MFCLCLWFLYTYFFPCRALYQLLKSTSQQLLTSHTAQKRRHTCTYVHTSVSTVPHTCVHRCVVALWHFLPTQHSSVPVRWRAADVTFKDWRENWVWMMTQPGRTLVGVSEAIDLMGFGRFQALLGASVGMAFIADAVEMLLLSILGPALACQWGISDYQQASLSTVVFMGEFSLFTKY